MKLQASILIGIILISGSIMKQMPWFTIHSQADVEVHMAKLPTYNEKKSQKSVNETQNNIQNDAKETIQVVSNNSTSPEQISLSTLNSNKNTKIINVDIDERQELIEKGLNITEKTLIEDKIIFEPMCNMPDASIFLAKSFGDGEVFFEKNPENRWPIASISKLIATVVVMEEYDFKNSVEITNDIYSKVAPYNIFKVGDRYSINDLVRASIVASSNDAVYALASVIGEDDFIKKMNNKAKSIGMNDTNIEEPSGLSYLNQSTANDLYKLIKYVYEAYPALLATSRNKSIYVTDLSSGTRHKLNNIDELVNMDNFYGGKTGFIDESGENLLAIFQKNGNIVMTLVMGSKDRFTEIKNMYNCVK